MVKSLGSDIRSTQAEILLWCFLALESVSHFTSLCLSFSLCENSAHGVVVRSRCDNSYKEHGHTPGTDPNLCKWHLCYYDVSYLTQHNRERECQAPPHLGWGCLVVMVRVPWLCHLPTSGLWIHF